MLVRLKTEYELLLEEWYIKDGNLVTSSGKFINHTMRAKLGSRVYVESIPRYSNLGHVVFRGLSNYEEILWYRSIIHEGEDEGPKFKRIYE